MSDNQNVKHRLFCEPEFPSTGTFWFAIQIKKTKKFGLSIGCAIRKGNQIEPQENKYYRYDARFGDININGNRVNVWDRNNNTTGMVVAILVDMTHNIMKFAVNSNEFENKVSFTLEENEKLYPACSLVYDGDSLEIIVS